MKRLTAGRAETYLKVEEILDDFEELWGCIPTHVREGALKEEGQQSEDPGARQPQEEGEDNHAGAGSRVWLLFIFRN